MFLDARSLEAFIAQCRRDGFNPFGSGPLPIAPRGGKSEGKESNSLSERAETDCDTEQIADEKR